MHAKPPHTPHALQKHLCFTYTGGACARHTVLPIYYDTAVKYHLHKANGLLKAPSSSLDRALEGGGGGGGGANVANRSPLLAPARTLTMLRWWGGNLAAKDAPCHQPWAHPPAKACQESRRAGGVNPAV